MEFRQYDLGAYQNMQEIFRHVAALDGCRELIRYISEDEIVRIHADTFWQDVRKAAVIIHKDYAEGSHIGVIGKNNYDWIVAFYGIISAGCVAVPMDSQLNAGDLAQRLKQADIDAFFTNRQDLLDLSWDGRNALAMDACKELTEDQDWISLSRKPLDPVCMIFTSGTTAEPKLVVMSNKGMAAGCCNNIVGDSFEVQLAILPFHHLAGFNPLLNTFCLGGIVCLEENLQYMMRDLELLKPDYMFAVPSMLRVFAKRLSHTPKGDLYGNALGWNLHLLGSGGASFEPDVMNVFEAHGIRVMQGYGASETGGVGLTMIMKADGGSSIGRAFPGLDVKLDEGELMIHSDSIMLEYYKDPISTAEVLNDGWYRTGDICRMDEEGYLHMMGRKKNLIILSNGENISPEALETRLTACDAIAEIMVFEKEDQLACKVRVIADAVDPDQAKAEAMSYIDDFNSQAPGYEMIRFIEWTDQPFPRNAMGKLVRR